MLSVRGLTFSYTGGQPFTFPDFEVAEGGQLLILGQSGVGKTTLLHLVAGLLKPTSGSVAVDGTELASLSGQALDRFRGQHMGIVFQKPYFVRALSVLENLLLIQHLAKTGKDRARCEEVLTQLNIADKANRKPQTLSEGEQQRVAIAMAVINRPALLLADEPTASLDDANCARVLELLKSEAERANAKLLIITHDQRVRAAVQEHISL